MKIELDLHMVLPIQGRMTVEQIKSAAWSRTGSFPTICNSSHTWYMSLSFSFFFVNAIQLKNGLNKTATSTRNTLKLS